tara:strand:+ start:274 stop:435 length:162 start_codon:yes stop_codon:yes gene_type:complete
MLYEVTILIEVDPDANFIASDNDGVKNGLEESLSDTIYDIDDIKILEMEVKKK